MKKATLPAVSQVTGKKLAEFVKSGPIVVAGFFTKDNKNEAAAFKEVAEGPQDYLFGSSDDAKDFEAYNVKAPAMILFRTFDDPQVVYEGDFSYASIQGFLSKNSMPLVGDIGPDNYEKYVNLNLPIAYFFYENESQKKEYGNILKELAITYKDKMSFVYIDANQVSR